MTAGNSIPIFAVALSMAASGIASDSARGQDRGDGALLWEVDATHLPALKTKVTLRLRPATQCR